VDTAVVDADEDVKTRFIVVIVIEMEDIDVDLDVVNCDELVIGEIAVNGVGFGVGLTVGLGVGFGVVNLVVIGRNAAHIGQLSIAELRHSAVPSGLTPPVHQSVALLMYVGQLRSA
jgi:hypothetical protein